MNRAGTTAQFEPAWNPNARPAPRGERSTRKTPRRRRGSGLFEAEAPYIRNENPAPRDRAQGGVRDAGIYFRCFETSFVISNMLTCFLPPKTCLRVSSALMFRRFFESWRPFFLMYAQSF